MKVQKEIENVTRVPNRYPIEPLTMEDAVLFHKKVVDNYEKMRKDLNKELGIGDIEEKGFTGRTDGKFSTPELKKMKLSESLFNEQLENTDGWPEEIGDALSGAFDTIYNIQYELENCVRGAYTDCNTVEELVEYIIDSAEFLIDRAEYLKLNSQSLNEDFKDPFMKDMLERVKDWYIKNYPDDDLGNELDGNISFARVLKSLEDEEDVYDVIGVVDSVVRERLFQRLAEILNVDYDAIYNTWLDGGNKYLVNSNNELDSSSAWSELMSESLNESNKNFNKKELIKALKYSYGLTNKEAQEWINTSTDLAKEEILKEYNKKPDLFFEDKREKGTEEYRSYDDSLDEPKDENDIYFFVQNELSNSGRHKYWKIKAKEVPAHKRYSDDGAALELFMDRDGYICVRKPKKEDLAFAERVAKLYNLPYKFAEEKHRDGSVEHLIKITIPIDESLDEDYISKKLKNQPKANLKNVEKKDDDNIENIPNNAKRAWSEDWIDKYEAAQKQGKKLDLSGYSPDEQKYIIAKIEQHYKKYENDKTYQAQWDRRQKKKAEQNKKEKIEKAKQAMKKFPGNAKSTLNKAGINI